jgi:hypothetical protein
MIYTETEVTDTLVIQHRLAMAAEDHRTVLLVSDGDHFVGKITSTGEDIYQVTNGTGHTREFGLSETYTIKLVNTNYARVELFPGVQPPKGKV